MGLISRVSSRTYRMDYDYEKVDPTDPALQNVCLKQLSSPVFFNKPQQIGSFSINKNREITPLRNHPKLILPRHPSKCTPESHYPYPYYHLEKPFNLYRGHQKLVKKYDPKKPD